MDSFSLYLDECLLLTKYLYIDIGHLSHIVALYIAVL